MELFETVGSTETLLRLIATYQGLNGGRRANAIDIWSKIATYVREGGEYRFYPLDECQSEKPGGRFRSDLVELIEGGFLRLLDDGKIEVTPFGRFFAKALAVPSSVTDLEAQLSANASNHHTEG